MTDMIAPPEDLDRMDLRILAVLQRDGRISNLKLAEAVALSPTAVLARVQRLTKDGYERSAKVHHLSPSDVEHP